MKLQHSILGSLFLFLIASASAQRAGNFNGLDMNLGNLYRLSNAQTRSISPENFTGAPGKGGMATLEKGNARNAARELGVGWKVNPYVHIEPGQTFTLAEITGPGIVVLLVTHVFNIIFY